MTILPLRTSPHVLLTSSGRQWTGLSADFLHISRGLSHVASDDRHRLGIHFGPPVKADCRCGGRRARHIQKAGDIDIIPAGMDGSWEDDGDCRILRISLDTSRLDRVSEELGGRIGKTELLPQFELRDAGIQAICHAIKADLEAEVPSDPLYIDLLADALAIRLIETAGEHTPKSEKHGEQKFSARQLRLLTDYIETHLEERLHLAALAAAAGVSVTRLKMLFRNSTGVPVHQYVIRRRVEYAHTLMTTSSMTASEIAVAAGFAHQSHMASTMRRLLGRTPGEILREAGDFRPKLRRPD